LVSLLKRDMKPSYMNRKMHQQNSCTINLPCLPAVQVAGSRDGFRTVWPWPLTFWPLCQCMLNDCYSVYLYHIWCCVNTSSRFPVRVRTNRQTDATERPTHAAVAIHSFIHSLRACLMMRLSRPGQPASSRCIGKANDHGCHVHETLVWNGRCFRFIIIFSSYLSTLINI